MPGRFLLLGCALAMIPAAARASDVAAITNESAEELGLASGRAAYAIIKASDVMVGVD